MKKKRKVKDKLVDQEKRKELVRLLERTRCIHELEGLLKDVQLVELVDPDFTDDHDDEVFNISLGIKWAIARLKGENLSVDDE